MVLMFQLQQAPSWSDLAKGSVAIRLAESHEDRWQETTENNKGNNLSQSDLDNLRSQETRVGLRTSLEKLMSWDSRGDFHAPSLRLLSHTALKTDLASSVLKFGSLG